MGQAEIAEQLRRIIADHGRGLADFFRVGLSNILDRELIRREPAEGSHG